MSAETVSSQPRFQIMPPLSRDEEVDPDDYESRGR
jgi:hypothetical protein